MVVVVVVKLSRSPVIASMMGRELRTASEECDRAVRGTRVPLRGGERGRRRGGGPSVAVGGEGEDEGWSDAALAASEGPVRG